MAQNCPKNMIYIYYTQEIILFQSDFDHPEQITNLESKPWNVAVLDSGATNTVAGKEWYSCYLSSLSCFFLKKTNFIFPFYGWGSTASRLQSHFEEAVYFLLLSSQKLLVLILSILER